MKYLNYLFLLPLMLAVVFPVILYLRWRPMLSRGASFVSTSILAALGLTIVVGVIDSLLLLPLIQAFGLDRRPASLAQQPLAIWLVLLFDILFVATSTYFVMRNIRSWWSVRKE